MPTRRDLLLGAASLLAIGGSSQALAQSPRPPIRADRLVFLGTKGGPTLRSLTAMPSASALIINSVPFLIDAGYGTTRRLLEAKISPTSVRYVFITHLHSDHVLELGPMLYNAWALGLRSRIDVYGPAGIQALIDGYWASMKFDIETRMADEGRPDLRSLVVVYTFTEGEVVATDQVTVSALRNLHPPIPESYAFKFEFGGKTVVFSGDTAYFPPLAAFAKGADYLIHEVMYGPAMEAVVRRSPNAATLFEHLKASHTLVEDVGRIAAQAEVKNLVLNHFVPADDPSVTDAHWAEGAKVNFKGNVILARDLMDIPL
jgi:ribonuclease BN (tRNA processing enzyme)